jgi:hypothetical protein
MQKINQKKSIQLNQAFGAVLTLILVAILVIVGIYLFSALQTSIPYKTTSVINESGRINGTRYSNTTYQGICNFIAPSSITAVNVSSNTVINAANYTIDWATSTIVNATAKQYDYVYFSFDYQWGGEACVATRNMTAQFGTYPALIGLLGTIIFLALVIGVLIASFAFGGKQGV